LENVPHWGNFHNKTKRSIPIMKCKIIIMPNVAFDVNEYKVEVMDVKPNYIRFASKQPQGTKAVKEHKQI